MQSGLNSAQVLQRDRQANGAVSAHAEIAHVIEENDTGGTRRVFRFAEQRANDCVRTARFIDDSGAPMVVVASEFFELPGERPAAKWRTTFDGYPGGFSAGMRVDDVNGCTVCRKDQANNSGWNLCAASLQQASLPRKRGPTNRASFG